MDELIAPLKNAKLIILEVLANFILIPAIAYIITWSYPGLVGDSWLNPAINRRGCAFPA